MKPTVYLLSSIVFLLMGSSAFAGEQQAQPAAISSDRPSFSASSSTVPTARFQLEGGIGFAYAAGVESVVGPGIPDRNIWSVPNLLGRYGIADFAELRAGASGVSANFFAPDLDLSLGSGSLGFKVGGDVTDFLSVGLLGTASIDIDAQEPAASSFGILDLGVTDWLSFTTNAGVTVLQAGTAEYAAEYAISALAAFTLTETLGTYVEWYASTVEARLGHHANVGMTLLVEDDVQFDGYLGLGGAQTHLGQEHLFGGVGLSTLF